MIKNFIFYLLFTFNLSVSYALVVKEVTIVDEGGSPSVSFSFDESFFLEPDQEDDETLLIEFPEDTKWQGPLSQDSNLGLSYTYIPYQDGSGDLVIKKEGRLAAGKLIQTNSNQYTLPFYAQNMPQKKAPLTSEEPPPLPSPPVNNTTPLGITKILAGAKNQNTRLVFALTRPTKFIVKENDDFSKVYVIPTEITQWKLAPASNQSFGSFKGYKLVQLKDDVAIELAVTPGTRIVQAALIDEKTSEPKLVLDLGHKSFVPTISRQANSERINDVYNSMKDQNNSLLSRGDSFSVFSEDHLVKSMNILVQNNDTIIRLSTTGVKNFDVQENSQTNELTILLPKMIWDHVNVTEQKAGLVEEFRVDQKDPNHTKLIFKLQKGTSIIGKKSFGREDDGRFVVYLNQREKKNTHLAY